MLSQLKRNWHLWGIALVWLTGSVYFLYQTEFFGTLPQKWSLDSVEASGKTIANAYSRMKLDGELDKYTHQLFENDGQMQSFLWGYKTQTRPDYVENFAETVLPLTTSFYEGGRTIFLHKLANSGRCRICHIKQGGLLGTIEVRGNNQAAIDPWNTFAGIIWIGGGALVWLFFFWQGIHFRGREVEAAVASAGQIPWLVQIQYQSRRQKETLERHLQDKCHARWLQDGRTKAGDTYTSFEISQPDADSMATLVDLVKKTKASGTILAPQETKVKYDEGLNILRGLTKKLKPGQMLLSRNLKNFLKTRYQAKKKGRLIHKSLRIELLLY